MPAEDPAEKPANIGYEAPPRHPDRERPWGREWRKPGKTGVSYNFPLRALLPTTDPPMRSGKAGRSRSRFAGVVLDQSDMQARDRRPLYSREECRLRHTSLWMARIAKVAGAGSPRRATQRGGQRRQALLASRPKRAVEDKLLHINESQVLRSSRRDAPRQYILRTGAGKSLCPENRVGCAPPGRT